MLYQMTSCRILLEEGNAVKDCLTRLFIQESSLPEEGLGAAGEGCHSRKPSGWYP